MLPVAVRLVNLGAGTWRRRDLYTARCPASWQTEAPCTGHLSRARAPCWGSRPLMRVGDVDQRAVRIGELEAAVGAFAQQREPRGALGIEVDRLGRQVDI